MWFIIVDGGSTDGTAEIATTFPVGFVRYSGNAPMVMSYECAIASGEIRLFADGDACYVPSWIESRMATFADPVIVASGGRCRTWKRGGIVPELTGYGLESGYSRLERVTTRISTMNLAVRRNLLDQARSFQASLDVAYDTGFGYRLEESGLQISMTEEAVAYRANRRILRFYLLQQYRYGQHVPIVLHRDPKALRGDAVTSFWMNVQPVLQALIVLSSGLGFLLPPCWVVAGILWVCFGLMVAGETIRIVLPSRKRVALTTSFLPVSRAYAWMFGGFSFVAYYLRSHFRSGRGGPDAADALHGER